MNAHTNSLRSFALKTFLFSSIFLGLILFVWLCFKAIHLLLLAFAGSLMALLVRGAATWLSTKARLSENTSIFLVLLAIAALFGILGYFALPPLLQQLQMFQQSLPQALLDIAGHLEKLPWGHALLEALPSPEEITPRQIFGFIRRFSNIAYTTLSIVFYVLIVIFAMVYFAVNPTLYVDGFLRLIPKRRRQRMAEVLGSVAYSLRWWLIASLIKMIAVGVLTFAGLYFLNVPLAFLLAVLAFFLDFVPYFGPIIAAIPAVMTSLVESPLQALYVTLLYFVVQQIEGYVISPILYEKTVYLPPVLTLFLQMFFALIAGAIGMTFATPVTAALLVLIKTLYVEDVLDDNMNVKGDRIKSTLIPQ